MSTICRDCTRPLTRDALVSRCPECGSRRLLAHPELDALAIAHIDCDAFYATIEKRDDPSLADKPVIVGGGKRGVVSAACYVSRTYGVHSAMPMFKALKACPDAIVIRPDMRKYGAVGREVRALMLETTPLVEPLSIDEAFLDLSGTERLHGASPARTLVRLIRGIEETLGITASVGLSYNKSLAKIASDLDKPRGFAVIGRAEAQSFLEDQPVGLIWGVGKALQRRLTGDGIRTIGQLRALDEVALTARYGAIGKRLAHFCRGEDNRQVNPHGAAKSISAETTFNSDLAEFDALKARLWPLCEKVSRRLKSKDLAGLTITLKLKTAGFASRTRATTLDAPTQLAETLYRSGETLLAREIDGTAFRLIGIGVSRLGNADMADPLDLLDPDAAHRAKIERTIDEIRARLGEDAIGKGRGLKSKPATKHRAKP
ncbi:MAG: DNA polymerase IV [Alphaproteobacteria bacterium]|nr:DNA polymerase IV [Alphaproteobacteria bacterium]